MNKIQTADILATRADTGEVRATLGNAATGRGYLQEAAVYGPDGFVSRPLPPTDGECAQALYAKLGHHTAVIGSRDNRHADKVGTMDDGDRMIVSGGEARIMVKYGRDAINLYTVNQGVDQSMMIDLDGAAGLTTISNGKAYVTMREDKLVLAVNGGGSITIDKGGIKLIGGSIDVLGGFVRLGDQGGGSPGMVPMALGASPAAVASAKVFGALMVFALAFLVLVFG